jgi:hypothetical protein
MLVNIISYTSDEDFSVEYMSELNNHQSSIFSVSGKEGMSFSPVKTFIVPVLFFSYRISSKSLSDPVLIDS